MAQKKAHEVDAWLRRPDPAVDAVLLYGPDRGLVGERASQFAKATALDLDDPFTVIRLDAGDIDREPTRLIEELSTIPMFAQKRLVWVRSAGASKTLADACKEALSTGLVDAILLIEAADLKKGIALRSLFEGSSHAMALPCYADQGKAIDSLIDQMLQTANLRIAAPAREMLRQSLGGDRLATRAELGKLALYCHGNGEVTLEDVRLSVGDVSGQSPDDAVDAILMGRIDQLDMAFARWVAAGQPPFLVLAAVLRQFQQLQRLRRQIDLGQTASQVVAGARPPVFFSRRQTIETALARWTASAIERALDRIQGAVLLGRQRAALDEATTRQALLALTIESNRFSRR